MKRNLGRSLKVGSPASKPTDLCLDVLIHIFDETGFSPRDHVLREVNPKDFDPIPLGHVKC